MREEVAHVNQVLKGQLVLAHLIQDRAEGPLDDFLFPDISRLFDERHRRFGWVADRQFLDERSQLGRHREHHHRGPVHGQFVDGVRLPRPIGSREDDRFGLFSRSDSSPQSGVGGVEAAQAGNDHGLQVFELLQAPVERTIDQRISAVEDCHGLSLLYGFVNLRDEPAPLKGNLFALTALCARELTRVLPVVVK